MKIKLSKTGYLILIPFCFLPSLSFSQIVLSEVMFDPIGNEYYDEFIEIFNINASDTIDLAGWRISDSSDTDLIMPHLSGSKLFPQQYAIILDPGYFENSYHYDNLIPLDALILTIDDGSFGAQGLSNTHSEPIILISSTGDTIARYRYSLDNPAGYSDEKRNLYGDDSPHNWLNSKVLNGTPGFTNSITSLFFDISVELVGFPPQALPGQSIFLIASITNSGLISATDIELTFFEDVNRDSLFSIEEQLETPVSISDSLKPGENRQWRMTLDSLMSGSHLFYAKAYLPADQDTLNNSASAEVKIGFSVGALFINEIMYRPPVGLAEWFELFNPGKIPVNIQQWQFSDSHTNIRINLADSSMIVPAQSYLIIAADSTIFQNFPDISCPVLVPAQGFSPLNNNGDKIHIYDLIGTIVDQVNYEYTWGNEAGVSLEKKMWDQKSNEPLNWALSQNINGGTPGARNSVTPKDRDLGLKVTIEKISPDSVDIAATIVNIGLLPVSQFQCDFYIDLNMDSVTQEKELVGTFSYEEPPLLHRDSTIIFQKIVLFNPGLKLLISRLIYLGDENEVNNTVWDQFIIPFHYGQILINEIMFRPQAGDPEWIEILNPGPDSINLFHWKFSDANLSQKHLITKHNLWIDPGSYVILAQSEDIFTLVEDTLFTSVIVPSSWPTLNNNADIVVLSDLTEKSIDSMNYFSHWNPNAGISLERIDFTNSGADSTNWASSIDSTGSTPARFNSVSPVDFDLAVIGISYSPENPRPDNKVTISVKISNVGRKPLSRFLIACVIDFNQDSIFQDNEKIGDDLAINQAFRPQETITVTLPYIPLQSGRYSLLVKISAETDFRLANNTCSIILSVGFERQALIINEIMYAPAPDEPEWIELFNPQNYAVDIQNWIFSDSDSSDRQLLTEHHLLIDPNSFLILTEDASIVEFYDIANSQLLSIARWPGLNNDGDDIYIFDSNINHMDKIRYTSRWGGNQGVSLERINPHLTAEDSCNWSSCVYIEGGTPGRKNSVYVEVLPGETELSISPDPFSPDGDGHDDFTAINYQLTFNLSRIHIKIYDIRGRLIRFLVNNRPSGTNGTYIWDGRDDQGHICRMGIYIVYLEAFHRQQGVVKSLKKSVVLAKQL